MMTFTFKVGFYFGLKNSKWREDYAVEIIIHL
jgi:hypothetical protein